MTGDEHPASAEQLQLLHAAAAPRPRPRARRDDRAEVDPVAQVVLDVGLAHLDRPFEYAVPQQLSEACTPGVRVKVRFAGRDVSGFVVSRTAEAQHEGRLTAIRTVVSPEPVLTASIHRLARQVADRYAGTLHDVLRLAIPPRHARAERALDTAEQEGRAGCSASEQTTPPPARAWHRYPAGEALLQRLRAGQAPTASWVAAPTVEPDLDWPHALAEAAAATRAGGRGVLLVVPDHRDIERVAAALTAQLGPDAFVRLTADQGPQARYTAWLKVLRGHVRCVLGTRAAAFAPVADLGLVAWWDDGDDLLSEPRAPYPHVREVLRMRSQQEHAALVVGGFARSVPVQAWLEQGLVRPVEAPRDRSAQPRIRIAGDAWEQAREGPAAHARIPPSAWQAAHAALQEGPVLVQVPRRGYVRSLRCEDCRTPARCTRCHGPLQQEDAQAAPTCRWCSQVADPFVCVECGGGRLRSGTVGARRTAEELGRAFSGVPVVRSGAGETVASVPADPALVISTPGAEPVAEGGYVATLLLDGWALLERPTLDAGEEALRRWLAAAALTRPGAPVVLCSVAQDEPVPAVQALVRWAPGQFAARELSERVSLALPPARWMALLTGSPADLGDAVAHLPASVERIGPMPAPAAPDQSRLLLRAPWAGAEDALAALRRVRAARSAHKQTGTLQVRVDPDAALL